MAFINGKNITTGKDGKLYFGKGTKGGKAPSPMESSTKLSPSFGFSDKSKISFPSELSNLISMDNKSDAMAIKNEVERLSSNGIMERNKIMEYLAANRIQKTLPKSQTVLVRGGSNSKVLGDIMIVDLSGKEISSVEVKMSSGAQALPFVVNYSEEENKFLADDDNPNENTQLILDIMNREPNLSNKGGKTAEVSKQELREIRATYQRKLEASKVESIYFVDYDENNDTNLPTEDVSTSELIDWNIKTPRVKNSGSSNLSDKNIPDAKYAAINAGYKDARITVEDGYGYIYTSAVIDGSKASDARHIGDKFYISSQAAELTKIDGQTFYKYRLNKKSSTARKWTVLSQISVK